MLGLWFVILLASADKIGELRKKAYSYPNPCKESINAWYAVLKVAPKSLEAHYNLGWSIFIGNVPGTDSRLGVKILHDCWSSDKVEPTIESMYDDPRLFMVTGTLGRWHAQSGEYESAFRFLRIALELSRKHSPSAPEEDACILLQISSLFDYFPKSTQAADQALKDRLHYTNRFLSKTKKKQRVAEDWIGRNMPGAAADLFEHCSMGLFHLMYYQRADVASVAEQTYATISRAFPAFDGTRKSNLLPKVEKRCESRKIRLGIVSPRLIDGHSNTQSFAGVFERLDRNIFNVTYIHMATKGYQLADFTKVHSCDGERIFDKIPKDINLANWTRTFSNKIKKDKFDIIIYTDLTMSPFVRRVGSLPLAPVQINTVGHPVTSGFPQSVMQYYVSWEAAELPLEEAQKHYTEELKLLPGDRLHLYYYRRILPGDISGSDKKAFGHLRRKHLGIPRKPGGKSTSAWNIYLCMQKPLKLHPEYDSLFCGILKKDPNGFLIIHKADSPDNQEVFRSRFESAGCDLERVKFSDAMPHHRLLAMYRQSNVVLDIYGDTTTREILELGKALVTLPTPFLGARFTLAYLNMMGLTEATSSALIASSPEDYITKCVRLATDKSLREEVEADILDNVGKLFERIEAVHAWQDLLLEVSLHKNCSEAQVLDHQEL